MTATRTVVTRTRREEQPASRAFQFTREMVPCLSGNGGYPAFLVDYRSNAWDAFTALPMPTPLDEPWRRTDVRGLEAGSLRLPDPKSSVSYPAAPADLL